MSNIDTHDAPQVQPDGAEPSEPHGNDMADVIEGPVGFASIVDPQRVPEREGTMPESGLAKAADAESDPVD